MTGSRSTRTPESDGALPLRVGLLMDHPSPHMVALLDKLSERADCFVKVVYLAAAAPGRAWGAPLGKLPYKFLADCAGPIVLRDVVRAMAPERMDVWVVNTCYTSPHTLRAAWWLHRRRKPWVYMNEPPRPRGRWLSACKLPLLQFVLKRAWGIIGMGRMAEQVLRRLARPGAPAASVAYYADLEAFLGLPVPLAPVSGEPVRFLMCGQMIHRKGLDVLLQACKRLQGRNWRLTLLGSGPLRQELEGRVERYGLAGRVEFAGQAPYNERHRAFAGHHVFVFPSRWDGWGMVVPEALAAGLPVIATDQVGAAHEFIEDGKNGYIIPSEDPAALADRMARFILALQDIPAMGEAARRSVCDYRPERGAQELMRFLWDIHARARRTRAKTTAFRDDVGWSELKRPDNLTERVQKGLRPLARTAVILMGRAAPLRRQAQGHRILAYHLVLKEDRRNFDEQIKFCKDHFRICRLSELLDAAFGEDGNGAPRLAMTFDDGFRVLMDDCLELLEKHGIKAGFFVPSGFVEMSRCSEAAADYSLRTYLYKLPLRPMRPEDLHTLTGLGHEIGAHGVYHNDISIMTAEQAVESLALSRKTITEWTGRETSGFAYPYGIAGNVFGSVAQWLRNTGYKYAVTLQRDPVSSETYPYLVPRDHVEGNWPVRNLRFFLLQPAPRAAAGR